MSIEAKYTDNRPLFPPAVWVDMNGEIENGDTLRFLEALLPFLDRDVYEIVIRLDSLGGSLEESLRLGRAISELPYATRVSVGTDEGSQICASACVNVYLGADYRFLSDEARIGVHRFSTTNPAIEANEAISISQDMSAKIVEYISAMRADPAFFNIMVSAHAEEIYWVPHQTLKDLHVVTGGIYSEVAEYRNIRGSIALYLEQISRVGTNSLTLICGELGLVGIFDLNEPEVAGLGHLELYVDGSRIPLVDFKLIERKDYRIKVASLFPLSVLRRLAKTNELGARIVSPDIDVFFGFEEGVVDQKIAETAQGCLSSLGATAVPHMSIVDGIDFLGGDMTKNGLRYISFEQCQRTCLSDDNCVAVTYIPSKQWCWPKNRVVKTKRNPEIISAYRD
jgi:hypothetical protein